MATASCIQSTWRSTGSTTSQTRAGGASISVLTVMPGMVDRRSGPDGHLAQLLGGALGGHDVDHHAGAALEPGRGDQLREQVDVPVVRAGVVVRSRVEHQVVGNVAVDLAQC